MAKSTTFSSDLLKLALNGTPIAGIALNDSSPLTNLYVALHTADPTASGTQTSSEVAYSTYTRMPVARSPGSPAWTVTTVGSTGSASPNSNIAFPTPSTTPGTSASFFSVGTLVTGTGKILYSGTVTSPITITSGTPPTLLASGSTITEG